MTELEDVWDQMIRVTNLIHITKPEKKHELYVKTKAEIQSNLLISARLSSKFLKCVLESIKESQERYENVLNLAEAAGYVDKSDKRFQTSLLNYAYNP
jgi:hypothetical protein